MSTKNKKDKIKREQVRLEVAKRYEEELDSLRDLLNSKEKQIEDPKKTIKKQQKIIDSQQIELNIRNTLLDDNDAVLMSLVDKAKQCVGILSEFIKNS